MAITTFEDITAIKAIISTDPYLNAIGFNTSNVLMYDYLDEEFTMDTQVILIKAVDPGSSSDDVGSLIKYEITVAFNKSQVGAVLNACQQVRALLHETDIGNLHILRVDRPEYKVDGPKGILVYEMRFYAEVTTFTQIRTLEN